MTTPIGLNLVWAASGGFTDPTDTKYQLGWVAEIPTYQNFNYVLQGLDRAKLSYAECSVYPWQDLIAYQAGAKVKAGGILYTCITTHNDAVGGNPQDPILDVTNSYWVTGTVYSAKPNAFASLLPKEGLKLDEVNLRTSSDLWESNDLTSVNKSGVIALSNTGATHDNFLVANVRGKIVAVNVGNTTDPDSRSLLPSVNATSYEFFHEGHLPTQSEVLGTIPDAPANDNVYGRQNNNWVITSGGDREVIEACISKPDFFANAEQRIRESQGSGHLEAGKHSANADIVVNEGISGLPADNDVYANEMNIGRPWYTSSFAGKSRTDNPIELVNGVRHLVSEVNSSSVFGGNRILFPDAVDGTKTYDSATGVVTTHATSNEAFEGVVTNGDFSNGAASWSVGSGWTISGGSASSDGSAQAVTFNTAILQPNTTYRLEIVISSITGTDMEVQWNNGAYIDIIVIGSAGTQSVEFTTDANTNGALYLRAFPTTVMDIESVSVMPTTESVITTRQDYTFLESFHESVETNDWFCPLGNTQYGSDTWEGIDLVNNYVAQGYSAFGEWDTVTKGYGKRWSLMSVAEKVLAAADSENNIYYDSLVGEFIQVKYRVRVIEGLGDGWEAVRPTTSGRLRYGALSEVSARGHLATSTPDLANTTIWAGHTDPLANVDMPDDSGLYMVGESSKNLFAHNGLISAIPIALVQRLNQGAYHPVYNSEGAVRYSDGLSWYATTQSITSVTDTFNLAKLQEGSSGFIDSGNSGRTTNDPFKFYDAIYAGQVEDLRLSSNRKTEAQLLSDFSRGGIAATIRGKESVPFTKASSYTTTAVGYSTDGNGFTFINGTTAVLLASLGLPETSYGTSGGLGIPLDLWVVGNSGSIYSVQFIGADQVYVSSEYGNVSADFTNATVYDVVSSIARLTSEYDNLPWQDILGLPERIAVTYPDGVLGQWIPEGVDNFAKNLSRKSKDAIATWVHTSDDGVNFDTGSSSIDTVGNTVTTVLVANSVILYQYSTQANPYELADNAIVEGEVGDVFASSWYDTGFGVGNHLIGKVATGSVLGGIVQGVDIGSHVRNLDGAMDSDPSYPVTHESISIVDGNSPTVKAFPYITKEDGLYYGHWVYKEIIFSSNFVPSGDDSKFNILDGESTVLNLDNVLVLVGQKRTKIPLGYMTGEDE